MRRLTSSEIASWKQRFSKWQSPDEMRRSVGEVNSLLGSFNLFNQSGLAFIRDAWIAGEFSAITKSEMVRLVSDVWPDFETKTSNTEQAAGFEAVEADHPGRRRGSEYKSIADKLEAGEVIVEDDPVEEWIARAEQAPDMLRAAARRKAAKQYAPKCNLVIYLNLSEYGIRRAEIEHCMTDATKPAKDHFQSVWVLWNSRAYKTWENGSSVRPGNDDRISA